MLDAEDAPTRAEGAAQLGGMVDSAEGEVAIAPAGDGAGTASVAPLLQRLLTFRSGGCTNYDSWAKQLRACVGARPGALHSVLLCTDGGATQRERFVRDIEAIAAQPGVGFFQASTHAPPHTPAPPTLHVHVASCRWTASATARGWTRAA